MTKLSAWKTACAVLLFCAATAIAAQAQGFNSLASFDGADGANPWFMSLVQGHNGDFYGTTMNAIFRINPSDGMLTSVLGNGSYNGAILSGDGSFYLVLNGAFYSVSANGVETFLCEIPGSSFIYGGLLQASDGVFYGTSYGGGNASGDCESGGCGFVFTITPDCHFNTLYLFNGPDGANPYSTLIETANGHLWGTTAFGGKFGGGTVFEITRTGVLTVLHDFNGQTEGARPTAGLLQGHDGNFYGTTYSGLGDAGSVFKMKPNGDMTTVLSNGNVGCDPYGGALIQATDGNFYGTFFTCGLYNNGSVVQITPSGQMKAVHSFSGTDGALPLGGLVQGTDGKIYGATERGGDLTCNPPDGCGTVFSLDLGLGPFVVFVRNYGRVGQTGGILGQGFTGTTSVSLNGIAASFTVVSDTYMRATVPAGATTGYVTVTTPSGTLTSNVPFHVIK